MRTMFIFNEFLIAEGIKWIFAGNTNLMEGEVIFHHERMQGAF